MIHIGNRPVGEGQPAFIVAEIGINHNGDLNVAKMLVDAAVSAGCDAVKFQKRTPELCVPSEQRDVLRETPWGTMTYMDYRYRVEFGETEYAEIDEYCRRKGITWFASPWDTESVDFLERFAPVGHKVASACLTDDDLLRHIAATGRPVVMSTGMSTMNQIRHAVATLGIEDLIILHCTSTYPCKPEELSLRMIETLRQEFGRPIGYSGHEVGLVTTVAAAVLGACMVERHITLDRSMWGSDQAASIEPLGFERLVRYVRTTEMAMGDGIKRVHQSELPIMQKLRRVPGIAE